MTESARVRPAEPTIGLSRAASSPTRAANRVRVVSWLALGLGGALFVVGVIAMSQWDRHCWSMNLEKGVEMYTCRDQDPIVDSLAPRATLHVAGSLVMAFGLLAVAATSRRRGWLGRTTLLGCGVVGALEISGCSYLLVTRGVTAASAEQRFAVGAGLFAGVIVLAGSACALAIRSRWTSAPKPSL
ncbi:MAG: hypothetical protein H6Q90_6476 [Deltaproteobacteria bacterium]|nr:hypothetical protein [Deltaproteobacteria bacterium]